MVFTHACPNKKDAIVFMEKAYKLAEQNNAVTPIVPKDNQITVQSSNYTNLNAIDKNIKVDTTLGAVSLNSTPDTTTISPNNDGRFDVVNFANSAKVKKIITVDLSRNQAHDIVVKGGLHSESRSLVRQ